MYRRFLGSFGNRSFIRPQYEIMEDSSLREIEDRWGEFPNGGTVSLTSISANYAQTECQFRYCGAAIPFLTVRSTAR